MTDIFKLTDSEKPARKQNALNLNITRTNQVRYGERSLRDLGPEIWNNLPAHIKSAPKLQCNFIEITLQHGHSPVNLLHIFITSFTNNTF